MDSISSSPIPSFRMFVRKKPTLAGDTKGTLIISSSKINARKNNSQLTTPPLHGRFFFLSVLETFFVEPSIRKNFFWTKNGCLLAIVPMKPHRGCIFKTRSFRWDCHFQPFDMVSNLRICQIFQSCGILRSNNNQTAPKTSGVFKELSISHFSPKKLVGRVKKHETNPQKKWGGLSSNLWSIQNTSPQHRVKVAQDYSSHYHGP